MKQSGFTQHHFPFRTKKGLNPFSNSRKRGLPSTTFARKSGAGFTLLARKSGAGFTLLARKSGAGFTLLARKSGAGFTLIELLVVISIIGFISTIALVNLTSARDKAWIAAGLRVEQQIDQGLSVDEKKDFGLDSAAQSCDYSGPRWCSPNKRGEGSDVMIQPNNNIGVTLQTSDCVRGNCFSLVSGWLFVLKTDDSLNDIFADGGGISLWFKQSSDTGGDRILVSKSSGVSTAGYSFTVRDANQIMFNIGISNVITSRFQWLPPAGSVRFGKWNHVAVIYNRDDITKDALIYVNGKLVQLTKTGSWNGIGYTDSAIDAGFGALHPSGGSPFKGSLDEIRVYSTDTSFNAL